MGTFSRTILRQIARTNMEKDGMTQINKKRRDSEDRVYSTFSASWRDFASRKIEKTEDKAEE